MTTRVAIIPCPDCDHGSDHALVCLGEGSLALFNDYGKALHECDEHKGRKPIELTLVDMHELWQMATAGEPGDGSKPLPEFWVSEGHLP